MAAPAPPIATQLLFLSRHRVSAAHSHRGAQFAQSAMVCGTLWLQNCCLTYPIARRFVHRSCLWCDAILGPMTRLSLTSAVSRTPPMPIFNPRYIRTPSATSFGILSPRGTRKYFLGDYRSISSTARKTQFRSSNLASGTWILAYKRIPLSTSSIYGVFYCRGASDAR